VHAFQITFKGAPRMYLAGEVSTIGDPYGERFGAKDFSNLDALDIVFNGLPAHGSIRMR